MSRRSLGKQGESGLPWLAVQPMAGRRDPGRSMLRVSDVAVDLSPEQMTTDTAQIDVDVLAASPAMRGLCDAVLGGGVLDAVGIQGSSAVLSAAAIQRTCKCTLLLVTAHLDEADEAIDEMLQRGIEAVRFPAMELVVGQTTVSPDLVAERIAVAQRLAQGSPPAAIVAPIQALMQGVPGTEAMGACDAGDTPR